MNPGYRGSRQGLAGERTPSVKASSAPSIEMLPAYRPRSARSGPEPAGKGNEIIRALVPEIGQRHGPVGADDDDRGRGSVEYEVAELGGQGAADLRRRDRVGEGVPASLPLVGGELRGGLAGLGVEHDVGDVRVVE